MNRNSFIGGTDVSALLGINPYKTAYDVFLEKTGQAAPISDNPAMYWGRALEPLIISKYEEETHDPVSRGIMVKHKGYDFIGGSLDGFSQVGVIEAKTSRQQGIEWGEPWTDQVPANYLLQVQHYMLLTGAKYARVPVLFGASDFRIYEVQADAEVHEIILETCIKFWQDHVVPKLAPPAQNSDDIIKMFKHSSGKSIYADTEIMQAISILTELKHNTKELEENIKTQENIIKLYLQDNDVLLGENNKALATWKFDNGRKIFDQKTLQSELPEIYNKYVIKSEPTRRFLLK